jgi:hypothetical protein
MRNARGAKSVTESCRVYRKRLSQQKVLVLRALNGANGAVAITQQCPLSGLGDSDQTGIHTSEIGDETFGIVIFVQRVRRW